MIAGRSQAAHAERLLAAVGAGGTIVGVRVHVPVERAEDARATALELGADCLVSIGGGSAVGLAKAVALTHGPPDRRGADDLRGLRADDDLGPDRRTAARRPAGRRRVAPRLVVYDPELTYDLPADVTAASGMNAVAHCVEALWAAGATPLTDIAAEEGLRLLAAGIRGVRCASPRDPDARATALTGAWLAGEAFAAGSALHHKLCHVIGGMLDLPHAELHAALLPYTAAFLLPAAPAAGRRIAAALDVDDRGGGHRAARPRRRHAALARPSSA